MFSSVVSPAPPAVGFPAGGWNATFLPSCKGSCLASASLLAFGSREKGMGGTAGLYPRIGATEFLRGGTVIDTLLRIFGADVAVGGTGTGIAGDGDGARGRLFRFSLFIGGFNKVSRSKEGGLPGGRASDAFRKAIRTPIRSMASSIALQRKTET